ncbi:Protein of unknown function [Gryllus bimaculatus]|nr:Protein of unknown function [Gryllus bimaculatus]
MVGGGLIALSERHAATCIEIVPPPAKPACLRAYVNSCSSILLDHDNSPRLHSTAQSAERKSGITWKYGVEYRSPRVFSSRLRKCLAMIIMDSQDDGFGYTLIQAELLVLIEENPRKPTYPAEENHRHLPR